jgi:hypothetical protein
VLGSKAFLQKKVASLFPNDFAKQELMVGESWVICNSALVLGIIWVCIFESYERTWVVPGQTYTLCHEENRKLS